MQLKNQKQWELYVLFRTLTLNHSQEPNTCHFLPLWLAAPFPSPSLSFFCPGSSSSAGTSPRLATSSWLVPDTSLSTSILGASHTCLENGPRRRSGGRALPHLTILFLWPRRQFSPSPPSFFWRNFLERTCATLRRHRHSNGHESATGAADLAKRATSLRGQNGGISTTMRAGSSRWHRCAWRLFPPPRRMVKGACLGLCLSGSSLPQPLSPCNGFTLCRSHLSSSDMRSRGGSLGKNILGWLFWILIKFEFLIIHIS